MRISDWSSDVCSSDLRRSIRPLGRCQQRSSTAGPPVSVSNSLAKRGPTPERLVAGANSGKRISGRKGKIRPEEPDKTVRRLYILGLHEPNRNHREPAQAPALPELAPRQDRKSTRLNSSHKCATR